MLLQAQVYGESEFSITDPNLFFGMTSHSGLPYLIKVSNTTKFRNFATKITNMEADNFSFSKKYNDKLKSGDNSKNIIEFFNMLQANGGLNALSVYEAIPDNSSNINFDMWKKLNWDGNGGFNSATICD
jgi:hypothetical protein